MWHEGAKRPAIGNHHAAEVISNKLYLFGGLGAGQGDVQIGSLQSVDGQIGIEWSQGAPIPEASGSAASAYIGGQVSIPHTPAKVWAAEIE